MSARGEDLRHPFFSPIGDICKQPGGKVCCPGLLVGRLFQCYVCPKLPSVSLLCLTAGRPGLQDGRPQLHRQELQFKHQFNVIVEGDYA